MSDNPFMEAFDGRLVGVRRWEQLDELWEAVAARADQGWYVYAVGEAPPTEPVDRHRLGVFIYQVDDLLRREHEEAYCGIVYADDLAHPSLVKVYDPNNLGAVCGSSGSRVLPGWVLSLVPPMDLQALLPPPNNRRRWWRRLFGAA